MLIASALLAILSALAIWLGLNDFSLWLGFFAALSLFAAVYTVLHASPDDFL